MKFKDETEFIFTFILTLEVWAEDLKDWFSVYLSEPIDTAHSEQKLMPEMNPSGSQEMSSVDDTLLGEEM